VGIGGRRGARNSPSLLNAMFNSGQFWDGRADTLEAQAIQPLINPDEMGNESYAAVVEMLQSTPEYAKQFAEVFGGPVTIDRVGRAIAAYERTLVAGNAPFDRFLAGDRTAMSDAAQRGLFVFRTRASCTRCHTINPAFPFLTDQNYRNTGVAAGNPDFAALTSRAMALARQAASGPALEALGKQAGASELGRFLMTGNSLDIAAFRTPSLRNVELTAPYFHDGSAATLADVVRFYVSGGNENPFRDWELQPLTLSEGEQGDLIEFLKALTSDDLKRAPRNGEAAAGQRGPR
jgi:cytochrome c peroxidase